MKFLLFAIAFSAFNLGFMKICWDFFERVFKDAHSHIQAWQEEETAKPLSGIYGQVVKWHVNHILGERYKELPQVGDLLLTKYGKQMFVVTHRYEPNPISPHGYVDIICLDEGSQLTHRIPVNSFFGTSYEKVVQNEHNQQG